MGFIVLHFLVGVLDTWVLSDPPHSDSETCQAHCSAHDEFPVPAQEVAWALLTSLGHGSGAGGSSSPGDSHVQLGLRTTESRRRSKRCVPITRQKGGRDAKEKELEGLLKNQRITIKASIIQTVHSLGVCVCMHAYVAVCVHMLTHRAYM